MVQKTSSTTTYFLAGLGIGSLIAILFAPRSGEETRELLAQRAKDGKEYTQRKARELRERAEDIVGQGREMVMQTKDQITAAIDAGREAYQQGRHLNGQATSSRHAN